MNNDKLNEIVKRLHGDFFVSCVGPVRTGKSTFINKFTIYYRWLFKK